MYIIKKVAEGELYLWLNKREDNFQMYLPRILETDQSNLEIYLCPDECCTANQVNSDEYVPFDNAGVIELRRYDSVTYDEVTGAPTYGNLVATHPTQLIAWPYDEAGNFTAPEAFVAE